MRRSVLVLALSLALIAWGALPGAAQPPDGGAVVLPVSLQGTFQPVTSDQLAAGLASVLRSAGVGVDALQLKTEDLRKAGFQTPDQPPSPAVADGLCKEAGKRYCVWLSLRLDATMGAKRDHLAMAGSTRFWAYDSTSDQVVLDAPLGSVHSTSLAPGGGPEALQSATQALVGATLQDLALQIVTLVQQGSASQRVRTWQAAQQPAPPPAPSEALQAMMRACQDYSSAVSRGDLIATRDAQSLAYSTWPQLNAQEQKDVEDRYPGTTRWMNGGTWYGGGYYYPPVGPWRY